MTIIFEVIAFWLVASVLIGIFAGKFIKAGRGGFE